MPKIEKPDINEGTSAVRAYVDPLSSQHVERMVVQGIRGSIDLAIQTVRRRLKDTRKIDGLVLPMDRVDGYRISHDRAICRAIYRISRSGRARDLTTYSMESGFASLQEFGRGEVGGDGRPSTNAINHHPTPDNGRVAVPYRLGFKIWVIKISTILTYNPAADIAVYLDKQINTAAVRFGRFRIGARKARFDGARIDYVAPNVFVVQYGISAAPVEWADRYIDDAGNFQLRLVSRTTSFTAPGFPINGRIVT